MSYTYRVTIDAPSLQEADQVMSALLSSKISPQFDYKIVDFVEQDYLDDMAEAYYQSYQEALIDEARLQ